METSCEDILYWDNNSRLQVLRGKHAGVATHTYTHTHSLRNGSSSFTNHCVLCNLHWAAGAYLGFSVDIWGRTTLVDVHHTKLCLAAVTVLCTLKSIIKHINISWTIFNDKLFIYKTNNREKFRADFTI